MRLVMLSTESLLLFFFLFSHAQTIETAVREFLQQFPEVTKQVAAIEGEVLRKYLWGRESPFVVRSVWGEEHCCAAIQELR